MSSSTDFDTALHYVKSVMISTGLIGNIITVIVFSRKAFQKNSISTYSQALAISQCLTLIQLMTSINYLAYKTQLLNLSDSWCKAVMYITLENNSIPGWILVAFSVDKTISMSRRQIQIIKKKWFQWSVVAAIVIFNVLLYLEILISLKLQQYSSYVKILYCDFTTLSFFTPFIIITLLESTMIPFVIMMVSSIITIRLLYRSRRSLERAGKISRERKSRDAKYAVTSIAFNLMHVVMKTPNFVWYILYANKISTSSYFLTISFFLFLVNCSFTFFVNFASNSIFRREFLILIRLRKPLTELQEQNTGHSFTNNTNRVMPTVESL
jgi:hypothetical protein